MKEQKKRTKKEQELEALKQLTQAMSSMYEQNKIMNEIKLLELQRQREQFTLLFSTTKMNHTQRQAYKDFDQNLNNRISSHYHQLNGEYKKTDDCLTKLEQLFEEL